MTELSNFDRIGLRYEDLENGIDPEANPRLAHSEVMGPVKWYNVFTGPNSEAVWVGDDGNGNMLTANPMFSKGSLFAATVDAVLEGQEPYAFLEADVHLSILEDGEVATRTQALMVNLSSRALEDQKGWFGRTKQVSAPFEMFTGKTVQARIAVFAHEVALYPTEEAFYADTTSTLEGEEQISYGSTSFMPSGMFPNEDGQTAPYGFGTGPVQDCGTAPSAFNGPEYHWAVVTAIGGNFGVVWFPQQAGAAVKGGYLSYSGMITAQWEHVDGIDT
ncbi:hypothetical protein [uncultured Litoreibacter sp.]|uniref:hypothetical protein n=1 Tax=uncultured Litoreibacter sp. TaxID=1392394 RepID=UPI00262C873E|nr:hypothetical protein [uncultured Litoreibacter sp.]